MVPELDRRRRRGTRCGTRPRSAWPGSRSSRVPPRRPTSSYRWFRPGRKRRGSPGRHGRRHFTQAIPTGHPANSRPEARLARRRHRSGPCVTSGRRRALIATPGWPARCRPGTPATPSRTERPGLHYETDRFTVTKPIGFLLLGDSRDSNRRRHRERFGQPADRCRASTARPGGAAGMRALDAAGASRGGQRRSPGLPRPRRRLIASMTLRRIRLAGTVRPKPAYRQAPNTTTSSSSTTSGNGRPRESDHHPGPPRR